MVSRLAPFIVAFVLVGVSHARSAAELTDTEFDAIRFDKEKCTLALFHADWSYSARKQKKELDELATYFAEKSNFTEVNVVLVDGHKYRKLARREGIHVIPLLVFYMWGGDPHILGFHDTKSVIDTLETRLTHDAKHRLLQEAQRLEHARRNIPHPNPGKVVEITTQELFDEQILDISKLGYVLFYANWCSNCKELMPLMDQLASHFATDVKVVIAKVDCALYGGICEPYNIEGFPTLMLFGKNKEMKQGMEYKGERELIHLQNWLNVHNNIVVDYDSDGTRHRHERNMQHHEHQRNHQGAMPHHYEENVHPSNRF